MSGLLRALAVHQCDITKILCAGGYLLIMSAEIFLGWDKPIL